MMLRCAACRQTIRDDLDRIGARCPFCRGPLYERPMNAARPIGPPGAPGGNCPVHPDNPSLGTCQRCGNFFCGVCRTRWQDRLLCTACVERALDAREARPEEARAHLRQAILALVFGLAAWLLSLFAGLLCMAAVKGDDMNLALVGVAVMVFLAGLVPALLGVGQGAAAIRARGDHMILASLGLILSGMDAGVVVGLITMSLFFNS